MPRATLQSRNGAMSHPPRWRYDHRGLSFGEGIARFRDPAWVSEPLAPFPGFEEQPTPQAPLPKPWTVRPAFADHARERHVRIEIEPGTSLYGTGEQAGPLIRNGTRKVCWNTDAFGYHDGTRSLYQSHPWVLAVRGDGTAFGVICETTWRCELDLTSSDTKAIIFRCDGPSPAVTVIQGGSPQEVVQRLSVVTGRMPMPPLWALGYQQCRWSYEPADRVRELAREFRRRRMPCDVIWLDIDYMERFRCFTFDTDKFPDPAGLNNDLHAMGFRSVWMIDPGLAADPEYMVYKDGKAAGRFVKATSHERVSSTIPDEMAANWGLASVEVPRDAGDDYYGRVWPGACAFPDFTARATRQWWAGLYKSYVATGIDGVWNDMNEPAVFDGPRKTMPLDNWHEADEELGGPASHAKYHNIYGMEMVRATREGIMAAKPYVRPFVLTRANFLGGHRYAATWTGDNQAEWRHLRWSIPMVLNLGLSGQPFSGPDIGGFGNPSTPEMFAVWMGVGALLPFARGHKIKDWNGKPMPDHEPWSFGAAVEETCRRALVRRYRLMPYLYTLFDEASRTGLPVCRPVFFADPTDARLRSVDNAFLLGGDVLVVCGLDTGGDLDASKCPMPRGVWREFEIGDRQVGAVSDEGRDPLLPRLYLRAGAAIALGPAMLHTGERPMDPITLLAAAGEDGVACGTLYEDAGDGYGYQQGEYRRVTFEVRGSETTLVRDRGGVEVVSLG